ncbi:hypothetical protein CKALI_11285 [Corynebacterium kalinowskii]|uniref:Tail terminator n=1 Tax=Corynebacterium kalinowskii TaxID=2675216 RepID=A0A6B8VT61_9CORY|nr:hypothetical protein [Corynebacterium kalinowskii]QGU03101.1 hypothetical protein CKALI_11285 [Corynebacterium kalinowskii]
MKLPTDVTPRPDIEDILCDLFEKKAVEIDPTPVVVTELPQDYEFTIQDRPIITIRKTTGSGTTDHQVDASFIELAVVYRTRREAWQLLNYLAAWLCSLEGRADMGPVRLAAIEEIKSPVMPKWVDPEHRRVQADFRMDIRRPR